MLIVVLVPLLAALSFAGLRIKGALAHADEFSTIEQIAGTSRTGSSLIQALVDERDLAVDPKAKKRPGLVDKSGRATTDDRAKEFLKELSALPEGTGMERQRTVTGAALDNLGKIRALADAGGSSSEVEHGYGGIIVSIASLYNQVGGIGESARAAGWTLYTIALDHVMLTSQRAVLSDASTSGRLNAGQQGNLLAAQLVRDIVSMEFGLYATQSEVETLRNITDNNQARKLTQAIQSLSGSTSQVSLDKVLPSGWYQELTDMSRQLTELRAKVESRVVAAAVEQKEQAQEQVVTDALLAGAVLIVAALLALLNSQYLVRGLKRLRGSAVTVAQDHLPEVTAHLSRGEALPTALEGKVLNARAQDEIGDVARAFDQVYLEAVRLARRQAALHDDVNLLFQNLSRRNQVLVQRQLALITELEQGEHEPEELSRLFHLDHLATRIRRNSENLLVLAGAEISAARHETTGLLALVRTAASEIEEYQRVTYRSLPDVGVVGYAADDLVHLIAELLDNAASFSSPDTWVQVSGRQLPDERVLLELRDNGIGMSEQEFAAASHLLEHSGGDRVDLSRTLGLYVVGALARKHGVQVRLRANEPAGVAVMLILPAELFGPPAEFDTPPTPPPTTTMPFIPAPPSATPAPPPADPVPENVVRAQAVPSAQPSPTPPVVPEDSAVVQPAQPKSADAPESLTESGLPVRSRRTRTGTLSSTNIAPTTGTGHAAHTVTHPDPAEMRRRLRVLSQGIADASGADTEDEGTHA
ncbi:sensor histidine kinase [Streptomyces noursei]